MIFYGTLMDLRLAHRITGIAPVKCQVGYVWGEIYEIIDPTEPNGIYKYPAITLGNQKMKIMALLVQYELKNTEKFWANLMEYEGDMYNYAETDFFNLDGSISSGHIAVIKNDEKLTTNCNSIEIEEHKGSYIFLKECII
ncbi:MAG: hypothetical protein WC178_02665 [Candidatus Paceibacterota bacterium]